METTTSRTAALAVMAASVMTLGAARADDAPRLTAVPVDENAGYLKIGELPDGLASAAASARHDLPGRSV